ncbi:MAG: FMN-binding protein [Deltaproteobacteria bacterium]|nr:FMN-binding protein [Deltaproteobacteria bacterium]
MLNDFKKSSLLRATRARLGRVATLLTAVVCLLASGAAGDAHAEAYWDKPTLLKDFFAKSERVTFAKLTLTAAQQQALRKRLGYDVSPQWTVYYGKTGARIDGVAILDNELGQHQPITFGVLIGPDGTLQRIEVMVYREAYGAEVQQARFRSQFVGKTAADPLRHGTDIVAIAGATISSRSMANGARRAMALADEVLFKPGLARVLTAPTPPQG